MIRILYERIKSQLRYKKIKSKFHFHSQNLDYRPGDNHMDKATGYKLKHGRAWLDTEWVQLRWSWNFWARFCGAEVKCSAEDGLGFFVGLPPVSLWFSFRVKRWNDFYFKHDWKALGFRIHNWAIWCDFWADESESRNYGSWFSKYRRRWNWHPIDTFLGRAEHSEERTYPTEDIIVAMPEGNYRGKAVRKVEAWKRKRWPFWPSAQRIARYHVDMEEPIPFPGKGENSWDCGQDALYGSTFPAETMQEAIASVTQSVLDSRYKYGGKNWKPEATR